jgi:hypothetical protein
LYIDLAGGCIVAQLGTEVMLDLVVIKGKETSMCYMNQSPEIRVHRLLVADPDKHPMAEEFYVDFFCFLGSIQADDFVGEEGEHDIVFLFLIYEKLQQLKYLLESYGLLLEIQEVTDDILFNRLSEADYAIFQKEDRNMQILNQYIITNLTKDKVLDKILACGMDSLTELDKSILMEGIE